MGTRSLKEVRKAFRDSFSKLSMLRSLFPKTPVLALTATANKATEQSIIKSLAMKNYRLIKISPNRINIRLSCQKFRKLEPSVLSWVTKGLQEDKSEYAKTLIYCQTIENVAQVFMYLKDELRYDAYDSEKGV